MIDKILILDGISGISLGTEIADTFTDLKIQTNYTSARQLEHRKFNKLNSAIYKLIHRHIYKEDYYRYPKITNQSLEQLIKQTQTKTIFVIGFLYRFFDLKFIQQLKEKYDLKIYLYDTDSCNLFNNKRELVYFFNQELPLYNHIYSFSKTTTNFINKINSLNASYFPFGSIDIKNDKLNKEHDILFVGSADMRRIFLLEELVNYKLKIYGSKWKRNHSIISSELNSMIVDKPIWSNALYQEISRSKIILNITRSTFYGTETGVNLRIFETLAAQSFLLTDYTPELAELFNIGQEIETYSCAEELKDKVDYYLQHENKRVKIAQKGYEKFQTNYTWKSRITELLSELQ